MLSDDEIIDHLLTTLKMIFVLFKFSMMKQVTWQIFMGGQYTQEFQDVQQKVFRLYEMQRCEVKRNTKKEEGMCANTMF